MSAKNTHGNIFINVLEGGGKSAFFNKNIIFDKTLYGEDGNSIKISEESTNRLNE